MCKKMNLFYKYSHLQRFEQQNEKDGRNVKDNKMRKEKWEMKNEKWRWEKEKEKRKDFPPGIPQQKVSLLLFRF